MKIKLPVHIKIERPKMLPQSPCLADDVSTMSPDAMDKLRMDLFTNAIKTAVLSAIDQGLVSSRAVELTGELEITGLEKLNE